MDRRNLIELRPLPHEHFPRVYELEPGDLAYNDWLSIVQPYQNFGIYKDGAFAGYLGLEPHAPSTVEIHCSVERKALHPLETRRLVIEAGIYLFQQGTRLLTTIHRTTNRPSCRLAKACGMAIDSILIRGALPHCIHSLTREAYLAAPHLWEI